MDYTVLDIEADGLLETVTKIHCLSYAKVRDGVVIERGSIVKYRKIKKFLLAQTTLVGHNIIKYDIPAVELILQIKVEAKLIDTLGLSWYLYPNRIKHGLEWWGVDLGFPKPEITDWIGLPVKEYIFRCESDVEINLRLFLKQYKYLLELYVGNTEHIDSLIEYLGFKLDCAREQEEVKCKLDVPLINKSLLELYAMREERVIALVEAMPRDIKYKAINPPVKLVKIDGGATKRAIAWAELLDEQNLPQDYSEPVMVLVTNEPGNPGSSAQIKKWLFSLGWVPITFEQRANKKGVIKSVPQINGNDGVCDSIKRLYHIEPALESLDMFTLINHRIGVFESYLDTMDDSGFTKAEISGITNTLRFKHRKPIVNLPSIYKFYGKEIRGAVIAPKDTYVLCGADMSSLEDTTKQHYMYFFDPDYVMQMRVPGFDPHLDIAVLAKMLTPQQAEDHKNKVVDYSQIRGKAKVVNFSGIYGAGPPKIAIAADIPLDEAFTLHKIYWQRNKAVKLVEKACSVKTIYSTETIEREVWGYDSETEQCYTYIEGEEFTEEQMWLLNPVSGFWYSLRYMKDKFSTLNQGTGVFCFDLWVREVRSRGIKITLQYHDEIVIALHAAHEDLIKRALKEAITVVNEKLGLNVPLGVDAQFGINYAEIH